MKHEGHLRRIETLLNKRKTYSNVGELRTVLLEELEATARYGHAMSQSRLIAAVERYDEARSR
jgi:hypothetical protein